MPTVKPHLALLRGVNVGGNKQVGMSDLRKWMEALGFNGAQTLLQSGNIVFSAEEEKILFISSYVARTCFDGHFALQ
jgi:uncharacterized protein (DUF1697 family)